MNWKILALTALLTPAAWADQVFIEPVKGAGVAESDRESVAELIRIAVTENSRHTVTSKAEEADITLAPALMKLGDSYVLSLQKKNKSGQTVYGEKMKAAKLNEISGSWASAPDGQATWPAKAAASPSRSVSCSEWIPTSAST